MGEEVLPEKGLLEKAAKIKRFEYSSLGSELQKHTDIAQKHYQGLHEVFSPNKDNKNVSESFNEEEVDVKTLIKNNLVFMVAKKKENEKVYDAVAELKKKRFLKSLW